MGCFESLVLGLVQGLTEFLPVSSSGHLLIVKHLFGIESNNATMEIVLHFATVLSTIVIFRREIFNLLAGLLSFRLNNETKYCGKIAVSLIPIAIVGLFFKDSIEALFSTEDGSPAINIVGIGLIITSILLFTQKFFLSGDRKISFFDALIIGVAQAVAVVPGLSRSGSTISTGLILGNSKEETTRFSFLIVIIPVLGESILKIVGGLDASAGCGISFVAMAVGFASAFISGLLACRWMIALVAKAKLSYFGIYCLLLGIVCLLLL